MSIILMVITYIIALLGLVKGNRAEKGEPSILSLNRIGFLIVLLTTLGSVISIVIELNSQAANRKQEAALSRQTDLLNNLSLELEKLPTKISERRAAQELKAVKTIYP